VAGRGGVPLLGHGYVDDLAELVDGAVEVTPPAGHLQVAFVDEPAIARCVPAWSGGAGEQRREPLRPPVADRDMIDLDTAFGQQLLDVAVDSPYRKYHRTATVITSGGTGSQRTPTAQPPHGHQS
jgi:hypothetical protein